MWAVFGAVGEFSAGYMYPWSPAVPQPLVSPDHWNAKDWKGLGCMCFGGP